MDFRTAEYFMREALKEAQAAFEGGEVPVGAVVVSHGQIIARGHNYVEKLNDVTAHAEMIALTAASEHLGSKYLSDCTLYVTLEPCLMCATALRWAQLGGLYFGASDLREGFSRFQGPVLHPKTDVHGGLLSDECGLLVRDFFRLQRERKRSDRAER